MYVHLRLWRTGDQRSLEECERIASKIREEGYLTRLSLPEAIQAVLSSDLAVQSDPASRP